MKQVRLLMAGLVALSLWGCGSGGGGAHSADPLADGRAALDRLAAGKETANQQKFQTILDLFLQAVRKNPDSSEAHFGAAICLAAIVTQQIDGPEAIPAGGAGRSRAGDPPVVGSPPDSGEFPPTPPDRPEPDTPMPRHHVLGILWNLDRGLSNPFYLLHMLAPIADIRSGLIPFYGYFGDAPERRLQMLKDLTQVSEHLEKVEADPNFSFTLPKADREGRTIVIGLPEVYLFHAYMQSLRAEIALSLAYIRDPGSWLPPFFSPPFSGETSPGAPGGGGGRMRPIFSPRLLDRNEDGRLSPDEYLPPSPFLTLRDAGLLQTAQKAMLAVAEKGEQGIAGALQRPAGDDSFLIPNTPYVAKALTEMRDHALPLIRQVAAGPVTVEIPVYEPYPLPMLQKALKGTTGRSARLRAGNDAIFRLRPSSGESDPPSSCPLPPCFDPPLRLEKVTIHLAAWFAIPPPDLKAFAPTFTLDEDGWIQPEQTVYPDGTFGGLFPEGLPRVFALDYAFHGL